jgi:hypothetical protein
MFDQPPLTDKAVFSRGFVQGLALLFVTFLLSLITMLPSRSRLYLGGTGSLWTSLLFVYLLFVWPVLCTIGCVALLFGKQERTAVFALE